MIKAEEILEEFIGALEADSFFDDIKIIKAYPHSIKPSFPSNAVVAAGIKHIELDDSGVMQSIKTGKYSIFTDIFVPYSLNRQRLEDIVFRISGDVAKFNIISIEITGANADNTAECFVMRAVFTFGGEIGFGEVSQ